MGSFGWLVSAFGPGDLQAGPRPCVQRLGDHERRLQDGRAQDRQPSDLHKRRDGGPCRGRRNPWSTGAEHHRGQLPVITNQDHGAVEANYPHPCPCRRALGRAYAYTRAHEAGCSETASSAETASPSRWPGTSPTSDSMADPPTPPTLGGGDQG